MLPAGNGERCRMSDKVNPTTGSLSERVRSLRLTDNSETTGNGWWWLPWGGSVLLLFVTGFLSLEAFSPIDDETIKKLAEDRGLNVGKSDGKGASSARQVLPGETDSASVEIALESKGYIVPISLIQVSPKVSGTV